MVSEEGRGSVAKRLLAALPDRSLSSMDDGVREFLLALYGPMFGADLRRGRRRRQRRFGEGP